MSEVGQVERTAEVVTAERFLDTLGRSDELPATDDVLARVMPLFEQVAAVHEGGRVAPLEGVEDVHVVAGRLFFAGAREIDPRKATAALARFQTETRAGLRVEGRYRQEDGATVADLSIGDLEKAIERPVYLPGFVAWEHTLGHHDPLTDIFSLGMIAASVALDTNLGDPDALKELVAHRRDLTRLNGRLHPVVARVIADMTELDRHARSQDLASIIAALRGYREQRIDLDLEALDPKTTRRTAIFRRLRDRLFDFSRRNRLLYFRPTASTVDLTATSIPLVLDARNIDPASLFTFQGRAAADLLSLKSIPLSRYVRFEDFPYAAPACDALRLEARRSRAELGFSQLRLVVCFLHWHDLKEAPEERITSPLLLLPVELDKKRGVRDAFTLTATDDWAEINPVLRQYLRQRYSIELPEHVDLSEAGALDRLHAHLVERIQATEPGVTLEKIDQPRIDLVLAVARKKLDAYRRKVALSGRHVRSRLGLDYAYTGKHIRPLGVQLFHTFVAPRAAPESVMHDKPRPVVWRARAEDTVTKELYSLKNAAAEGGPFRWAFDLTSMTLANFNYRNVSLVRDYATLVEEERAEPNPAFEAIFRDGARPLDADPAPLPLAERHEVVLADPTQGSAVARARGRESYVIQGPPGTGKSQTITNLIADHVARGKRVLFVCEKRAALDVVFHRLVQVGMGPLACLIHDAQDDKKEFIKDLKTTYEGWLAAGATTTAHAAREAGLGRVTALLERGRRLQAAMTAAPEGADASLLELLRRAVELRDVTATEPDGLTIPAHRVVAAALGPIERVESSLRALGHGGPLATHPARLLGEELLAGDRSIDDIRRSIAAIAGDLVAIERSEVLVRNGAPLGMAHVVERHRLARLARPLVVAGFASLLDPESDAAMRFRAMGATIAELERAAEAAAKAAAGWRDPLAPDDASRALVLARRFEGGFVARLLRWLQPGWWRLRRLLRERFDIGSRAVLGDWTDILDQLVTRQRADVELAEARAKLVDAFPGISPDDARAILEQLRRPDGMPPAAHAVRDALARGDDAGRRAAEVAAGTPELERNLGVLAAWEHHDVDSLRRELAALERDTLAITPLRAPLAELDRASRDIAGLLRRHPLTGRALEALTARRAIATATRERAPDLVLPEGSVDAFGEELTRAAADLRAASAEALVEAVRARFVERAQLASAPAAGLSAGQKETKRLYAAGRRELEHELGKVMRHKTIREIVSGPAGAVVRDLKPIWLMSPLSVADVLPLASSFDLVIFDEASQIPLEDAVPAIHRASQCIVVGDRQQLPPTNFFAAALDDEEEADEALEALDRELDADSLLTHADRTLPSTLLGWHYRSRDESLIDFSNRAFYAGRLLTVPPVNEPQRRNPITARAAEDAAAGCERMLERPISVHRIEGAVYETRRNVGEARYVARLVQTFLARNTGLTMGVVAFSEAQQGAIESALAELCDENPALRTRLDEEMAREDEGQHVGLFIKNLENVQGDERDVIIVSICYGPDARGRMIMNFGPINRRGGERRLNVIFSRAKHHVAVVTTIGHERITNDYNDGAACLKSYLRYAEHASIGDMAGARAALLATAARRTSDDDRDPVVADIAAALRAQGWHVAEGVGASRLRCDLAIRRPNESRYRLGVLLDRPEHWALGVDEALRLKPGVLRAFGWRVTTVLTKDWLLDRNSVLRYLDTLARA